MFQRLTNLSLSNSFFVFGARGTGKSTLIQSRYGDRAHTINLLETDWVRRYQKRPDQLRADLKGLVKMPDWVVIDEIQKVPELLDVAHDLIEKEKMKFILTGSSARKLRRYSANLLAGRAFISYLYPLTASELGSSFQLEQVLNWGSLPRVFSLSDSDRSEFLRAYTQTYLREEILQEQLVRNGVAFQDFLEIAAQENGQALNYNKIAREIGVDIKTVQNFFSILEDTLVGFRLPSFHRSVRKSQLKHPKFYLFDLGVKRAMQRALEQKILPSTQAYGRAFEHFLISEAFRLNEYYRQDFKFSHFQTTQGAEVDLVLSRARTVIAVEIKSTARTDEIEVRRFARNSEALSPDAKYFVSQDPVCSQMYGVECLPWEQFLARIFRSK